MVLSEITMFVLCVAVAGLHVLNPLLESLQRAVSPHSPVLVCIAGLFMPLALATAYNMGVMLVYLQVAPAPAALMSPAAVRRFAALACAIASVILPCFSSSSSWLSAPGIVVLALGAGALGGPDALRLLITLAGRNPVVDIGICVFVIGMFAAQLLGILLLARYVRKPPPPAGGAGAGRGAPGTAPAADPLACITLLLSLAAASLVTASLVVGPGGPGSVRPLVDLAAKYCYPIAIAAGAALLYATPLLRVFREPRNAHGRAAPAERAATTRHAARCIGLPLVVAAVCVLLVAIRFGADGGLDALRLCPGHTNTPVAVAVGATLLVLVRFYRRARNAAPAVGGDAAPAPSAR
uniref:Uncharacterized protein n=1 Tax=Setaria viridis TaxID=4556 RepID=A0A4U6USV4_SETVI|nr:hypothetical protein SEVIR_4G035700v2 [Setaria viridis]